MIICALRNDKGEYVSMSGDKTTKWLEASKFDESQVESRLKYTNPEFKLVTFEVKEVTN